MINKKLIALFFALIMVASIGIVLFSNSGNSVNNLPASAISGYNNSGVVYGSQFNGTSGLVLPQSSLGSGSFNDNPFSLSNSSYDTDTDLGSDGSSYGVVNGILIFNVTENITNEFIGYPITIASGVTVTFYKDIWNPEQSGISVTNSYLQGQLILIGDKVHGDAKALSTYSDPIDIANNSYGNWYYSSIYLTGFIRDSTVENQTYISNAVVYNSNLENYPNVNDMYNNVTIKYSDFNYCYVNFGSEVILNFDTITVSQYYHNFFYYGNGNNYFGENVSILNSVITTTGNSYDGLNGALGNYYYDDYMNFTIPSSDWSNTGIIDQAINDQIGFTSADTTKYRGSEALNDSAYPVIMNHVDFSGLSGFEIFGSGNFKIENSHFIEQFFWTAYFTFFEYDGYTTENGVFENNTFSYYADSTLENNIDSYIGDGGGNTYITTGEAGNINNINLYNNTFEGSLFTIEYNSNEHGTFILGSYNKIEYNTFDTTCTFNSGANVTPDNDILETYQDSGNTNISHNIFSGLQTQVNAITWLGSGNTINLSANNYIDVSNALDYQILIDTGNTLNIYNATGYPDIVPDGTYSYTNTAGTRTMDAYINEVVLEAKEGKYQVTFTETGLPSGTSWNVYFNSTSYSSVSSSITVNGVLNGTYSYSSTSSGYSSLSGKVTVNGASVTVNLVFTFITVGSKQIGNGTYYYYIIINKPATLYYNIIIDQNGKIFNYTTPAMSIEIKYNSSSIPLNIYFQPITDYEFSQNTFSYSGHPQNITETVSITKISNDPSYLFNKYFEVIVIFILFSGLSIIVLAISRRY